MISPFDILANTSKLDLDNLAMNSQKVSLSFKLKLKLRTHVNRQTKYQE